MATQLTFEIVPLVHVPRSKSFVEDNRHHPVVLVVDNDQIIADTRVAILASWGYSATACYDGESAIEMARVVPPEILITDVLLGRMNGVDLGIAIRSISPDCRVLLFSGRTDSLDLLERACSPGQNFTLLRKPVHPSELLAHLMEIDPVHQPAVS